MEDLYQLYRQLEELALAEQELIRDGEYQSLKLKLDEKNKLIRKIDKLDRQQYFREIYQKKSDRAALEQKQSKIYQLLKNLNKLEEKKITLLKQKKENIKNKILELYSREKSIRSYRKEKKYEAKFFDEKS